MELYPPLLEDVRKVPPAERGILPESPIPGLVPGHLPKQAKRGQAIPRKEDVLLDIKRMQITGDQEYWIALPDGYAPTGSFYQRKATGGREALAMLRDVAAEVNRLPKSKQYFLVFSYSEALLSDPKHGRDIERQIKDLTRKGEKVGVRIDTTTDARPTR